MSSEEEIAQLTTQVACLEIAKKELVQKKKLKQQHDQREREVATSAWNTHKGKKGLDNY